MTCWCMSLDNRFYSISFIPFCLPILVSLDNHHSIHPSKGVCWQLPVHHRSAAAAGAADRQQRAHTEAVLASNLTCISISVDDHRRHSSVRE